MSNAVTELLFRSKWQALPQAYRKRFQSSGILGFLRNRVRDMRWWVLSDLMDRYAPGASALDLGCGGGLYSGLLTQLGYNVVGIDLSSDALLSNLSMQRQIGTIAPLTQADSRTLPFAAESFDMVFSTDVLGHVPDHPLLFKEIWRVLKPGGNFVYLSETDGYRSAPQTWQYQICRYVKEDPWETIDLHIALVPASAHVQMAEQSGFIVEERFNWVRNHLLFRLLMPHFEPELISLYPQLRRFWLYKMDTLFVALHQQIDQIVLLKWLVATFNAFVERQWIAHAKQDTGGVFLKLRKPETSQ